MVVLHVHGSLMTQRDCNTAQKHNLRLALVDCGGIRMDDANIHGSVDSRRASRPGRKKSKSFLRHIPASGNYFGLSRGCVETEPDGAAKVPDTETGESVRFRCPVCGSDARGLATGFRSVTNSMMFAVGGFVAACTPAATCHLPAER